MKKSNLQNTIFMLSVLLGWGLISMVYSVEWYSRVNCPRTQVWKTISNNEKI